MKNSLVFFSLLIFGAAADASTQLIVRSGGQSATVLMLAATENPDATAFYELLTAPATVQGNKESKQIGFTDEEGKRSVEITCAFSRLVTRTGSCVLSLNMARGMTIDPTAVTYVVEGRESETLANFFHRKVGDVFRSTDGHLAMTAAPGRFEITYR